MMARFVRRRYAAASSLEPPDETSAALSPALSVVIGIDGVVHHVNHVHSVLPGDVVPPSVTADVVTSSATDVLQSANSVVAATASAADEAASVA